MTGTLHRASTTYATFEALEAVARERERQDARWGRQAHAPAAWVAILVEEVGEVAKEVAENVAGDKPLDVTAYVAELAHVAAVAVAAIEACKHGAAGVGRPLADRPLADREVPQP